MTNEINRDIYKYTIEARNQSGTQAMELIEMYFKTQKAALNYFDHYYNRKGFTIVIYKFNPVNCYEKIVHRIVKSSYK